MSLKIIPTEHAAENSTSDFASARHKGSHQKHKQSFNPGSQLNKKIQPDSGLKEVCLRLVHFINRGSKFTYEQVDDIIVGLHQSILKLQKKKQEILKNKGQKKKKR